MSKVADPRTLTLEQCQEELLTLEAPCHREHLAHRVCPDCNSNDGEPGKVYPLREPCSGRWCCANRFPLPSCSYCHGAGYAPVAPHLETYRAAAMQVGLASNSEANLLPDGSYEYAHNFGGGCVVGKEDLRTCARALVLAKRAREGSDGR